jgi:hypothetical protein
LYKERSIPSRVLNPTRISLVNSITSVEFFISDPIFN